MLIESDLPRFLWPYAVMTASHIRNRVYCQRIRDTPYHLLTGKQPSIRKMHLFGSVCYANLTEKKKLDPRCEKGFFVGYDKYSPAYLIYFPNTNTVKKNRTVKFTEKYESTRMKEDNVAPIEYMNPFDDTPFNNAQELYGQSSNQVAVQDDIPLLGPDVHADATLENEKVCIPEPENERRYPERTRTKPKHLSYCKSSEETYDRFCKVTCTPVPTTFKQASNSDENEQWNQAMESEMNSLRENKVYTVEPLPAGKKVVGSRWVFARKSGPDKKVIHKARFVAKGFAQIEGSDYTDTFAPTAKMATIRMLIQFSVEQDMLVHQMDVKTAYLNAPIDCEVFLKPPEGFPEKDSKGEPLVWRLHKSLYGLKQSGRNWNFVLSDFLKSIGFKQSEVDACLFTKFDSEISYIVIWVDDIVIATNSEIQLNAIKKSLMQRFKMTDLGPLSWFLGIEFHVTSGGISMCQSRYIEGVLKRFGMESCNPRSTPCESKLDKYDCSVNNTAEEVKTFRQIVGSLIYAMTCTRPDLAFVVTKLSQSLEKPSEADWITVKHVMRYLKGTIDQKLMYNKSDEGVEISGFSDSDWASSHDRRSTTGFCFSMNRRSAVVSWKSKKQQTVALSSCEAEYMALTAATQEAMFLSMLAKEFGHNNDKPISIFGDNQGSLHLVKNPVINQRSKHIDIKFHFIREKYTNGFINVTHVPSGENLADIMTKPPTRLKLIDFQKYLFGEQ